MTMQQLREAFAAWPFCDPTSHEILAALKDPTPITEAGLRDLGYDNKQYPLRFECEGFKCVEKFVSGWAVNAGRFFAVKTLGQLRRLLLSVGE
jgi:hypothetical protein